MQNAELRRILLQEATKFPSNHISFKYLQYQLKIKAYNSEIKQIITKCSYEYKYNADFRPEGENQP
ncbi:MAG: hypothetical protein IJA55_04900 [Clostridia bacterium]|nr:hypothetical protein [Clostridia bacterium]